MLDSRGVIITAPGNKYDFVSRAFFQNMESLRIQSLDLLTQNLFHTGMEEREVKLSGQNKFLKEVG